MRLIIHQAKAISDAEFAQSFDDENDTAADPTQTATFQPGQVVANKDQLIIQTGQGKFSIEQIQPAGKRSMPIADFLRGKPPEIGDRLSA